VAMPLEITECFKILGVSPGAHQGEIRAAFRRLALSFHPDVAGPGGAEKFEAAAAAYSILKTATPEQMADALKKAGGRKATRTQKTGEGSRFRWGGRRKKETPPAAGRKEEKKEEKNEQSSGRVRELLLERALVDAELAVARLLEKSRGEEESPAKIVVRLLGDHPEVRLMALRSLVGKPLPEEIFAALLDMARRRAAEDEVLELLMLMDLDQERKRELARALASRFAAMGEKTALTLLRLLNRLPDRTELLVKALLNPSARVIAAALVSWPPKTLPDELILIRLIKREEEAVLVPLLRLMKSAAVPSWAGPRITALSEKHSSPAVRVWAGSIVRSGNLL
jgi:curved DNA-binding protein CbpA